MITAWGENLLANGDDYINDTEAHDRQIALFGDATYTIVDGLKLNLGVRYAWTHFDFHNLNDGPQDLLDNGGVPKTVSGKRDETPLTPKIGLSYQLTSSDMVYGSVSKGYRIGGVTPPLPIPACGPTPFPTQYSSDSVISYEVGTKDRFFDRKLYIASSLFHVDWKNIQQAIYVGQCGIQYTANAGNAVSQGFDLEAQWQLVSHLDLELSVGYTDAHFTGNAFDQSTGLQLSTKGDVLNVAPWTVTLGAQYDFSLFDKDGYLRADYEFNSRRTKPIATEDPANTGAFVSGLVPDPATSLVSLRAGLTIQKLDFALFVDNLLDAHPQLDLQHEDTTTALFEATTFRPRTIGIAASYKY
jgi:outer membrane receptor protein involved in Fe transport